MSEATFTLRYDGSALADHTMDVADLAPALVALSQYMKSTARVVNGERFEVAVRVKAVETGCFQVVLQVTGGFIDQMVDMLSSRPGSALANLVGVSTAAVTLVAHFRSRKVRRLRASTPGRVAIELEDGEIIEVEEAVARVATDANARAALEKVVADPLDKDGVDEVRFGPSGSPAVVSKEQADDFRAPVTAGDELLATTSRMVFSIVSVSFQPGNKWRVSTGRGSPISVTVADDDFTARVQNSQEAFAKGDFLICEVRTTSRQAAGKLATEYVVEKVLEHRRAEAEPAPIPLF